MEKLIPEGKMEGKRNRERPERSWEKDVEYWMGASGLEIGMNSRRSADV